LAAAVVFGPRLFNGTSGENTAPFNVAEAAIGVMGFENLSDPADPDQLGRMLMGLITTDLAESHDLKVVTTPRILSALRHEGGDAQTGFDAAVAEQAANRAGIEVMVVGQILQDGDRLLLTAELAQVKSGNTLGSLKKEASSKADLFALAEGIAQEVRNKLGVSDAAAATQEVDLTRMLTDSPQAYRHYAVGEVALHRQEWDEAVEHFDHSVREDPTFAMAYYRKAQATWWGNSTKDALQVLKTGEPHIGRLPERWQLLYRGSSMYFDARYRDAYHTLIPLVGTSAETPDALYALGEMCEHSPYHQDHEKAMTYFERAIELDPSFKMALYHLIDNSIRAEDLPAAERAIATCRAETPNDPGIEIFELWILMASGEIEEPLRRAERFKAEGYAGADEYILMGLVMTGERERAFDLARELQMGTGLLQNAGLGHTQVSFGRFQGGLETLREHARIRYELDPGSQNSAEAYNMVSTVLTFMGDLDGGRDAAKESMVIVPQHFQSYGSLALALHKAGKASDVDEVLVEMERVASELNSARTAYWVDLTRARVHLWRGEIAEAEADLERAVSHPPVQRAQALDWFVRGKILDAKGDAAGAAAAYGQSWKWSLMLRWNLTIERVMTLYLWARAEEKAGNLSGAREQYERFLHYWGEADIPIPEVDEAKESLQALEAKL
jgi:tetratricopeptide (TPR) repeat protein